MAIVNGPISQNDLMLRLANAKKVINKVDSGDYSKGNINESQLVHEDEDEYQYNIDKSIFDDDELSGYGMEFDSPPSPSTNYLNEEKINQSKLPDAIKRAMIENPIPTIKLDNTLNMDFVKRTKQIMEQEGVSTKTTQRQQSRPVNQSVNNSDLVKTLTPIIENIIRKTLDEIIDKKLNQILTAQQTATINENLVLKVGESIFKGKITGVSKAK